MATNLRAIRRPSLHYENPVEHRATMATATVAALARAGESLPKDGTEAMESPLLLAQYTEATPSDTRPAAADWEGGLLYTSDTKRVFVSDGTSWVQL